MSGRIEKLSKVLEIITANAYKDLESIRNLAEEPASTQKDYLDFIADMLYRAWYKPIGLKRIQARVIELARENRELKIDLSAYKRALDWHEKQLAGKHAAEMIEWDTIVNFKRPSVIKRIWDWFRGSKAMTRHTCVLCGRDIQDWEQYSVDWLMEQDHYSHEKCLKEYEDREARRKEQSDER